jgi:hypothetical protein
MRLNYDMLVENPKNIMEILASMPPVKKGKKGKKKRAADL